MEKTMQATTNVIKMAYNYFYIVYINKGRSYE